MFQGSNEVRNQLREAKGDRRRKNWTVDTFVRNLPSMKGREKIRERVTEWKDVGFWYFVFMACLWLKEACQYKEGS